MRVLNAILGGAVVLVVITHLSELGAWVVWLTKVKIPTP